MGAYGDVIVRRIVLGAVVLAGIAVLVFWGTGAFFVFLAFALFACAIAYTAALGGDWLTSASRGRFDDGKRRRS